MSSDGFFFDFGEQPKMEKVAQNETNHHDLVGSTVKIETFPNILSNNDNNNAALLSTWGEKYQNPEKMEISINNTIGCVYYQAALTKDSLQIDNHEVKDIIPGRYYGGLKVWSCAPYLSQFMATHNVLHNNNNNNEMMIAELGAGQGMPLLTAILLTLYNNNNNNKSYQYIFQDYNEEVIVDCTQPNFATTVLQNNLINNHNNVRVDFISGDWEVLAHNHNNNIHYENKVNIILGSDVTFDELATQKLVLLLQKWLSPIQNNNNNSNFALIATKEYYFGTNGGVHALQTEIETLNSKNNNNHKLMCEILDRVEDSLGMNRMIVKIWKV
ncbi:hypothetical protein AGDE_06989 [Angomonas deanei]|uniref:protein-histidine N-methyltransferase n=1 Tax=Angomonas deanei TaxID=59799 RepID=A0A7G2CQY0_9TRYP|nr:hypothetical protein AGDE_06989 [Angomonas deanei]CAD2221895.1 Lysine methyltransferase, putative [Angomonas deanei]|eukprot:EPY36286.1 hypothetical protein AGDE_06989 [Angomonas deanei]